jgi:RNA polymerase sigma-70 factor (ECF subfamily)
MAKIIPLHSKRVAAPTSVMSDSGDVPVAERSDDELMLLARGGVERAFDTLVRRHQRRVLRIAAKYMGCTATATDIAQNTFLELYRALPRYRAQGKFSSYLYRSVLNQCRMTHRASQRRAERMRELAETAPAEVQGRSVEAILGRERRRDVEEALGALSGKLRDVVVLRFACELSYQEMAEVLDIPVGTVKSRLFAGLEKLREHLERDTP